MTEKKRLRGIRFWATCVTLAAANVFTFGCKSSANQDPTGGETHWLQLCADDDGCSEGECLCGVCSQPCEVTSDCGSGASCESSNLLSCDRDIAPVALCLPECTPGSCGPSGRCNDGICVPLDGDEREAGAQSSDDPSSQSDASFQGASDDSDVVPEAGVVTEVPRVDEGGTQPMSQGSLDAATSGGNLLDSDIPPPQEAAATLDAGVSQVDDEPCTGADCSESCSGQDAVFMSPCLGEAPGYAFDGTRCVSGCGCAGTACDQQFSSMQECVTEFASCLQSCESVPSEALMCVACESEACSAGDPIVEVSDGCCVCQASVGLNPDAVGCVNPQTNGSVTIELEVLEDGYEMTGGCEVNSVSIFDEYGRAVWPMPRSSCVEDAESVLAIESTSIVWDGSSSRETFAAPGPYTAVVCANNPGSVFTCASAQFDYPSDEVVNLQFPASQTMTAAHFTCSVTDWPCLTGRQWCDGTCRTLPEECREDPCSCFDSGNIYRSWSDGDTSVEECSVDELGGVYVNATSPAP